MIQLGPRRSFMTQGFGRSARGGEIAVALGLTGLQSFFIRPPRPFLRFVRMPVLAKAPVIHEPCLSSRIHAEDEDQSRCRQALK